MRRVYPIVAILAVLYVAPTLHAEDEKKTGDAKKGKAAKIDQAKLFVGMDTDKNDKLDKDELKAGLTTMLAKLKEKAAERGSDKGKATSEKLGDTIADKLFDKLDVDKDGSISKAEFEKAELGSGKLKELAAKRPKK